jgi:hypothetical protein
MPQSDFNRSTNRFVQQVQQLLFNNSCSTTPVQQLLFNNSCSSEPTSAFQKISREALLFFPLRTSDAQGLHFGPAMRLAAKH